MSPAFDMIVSSENSCYMGWQTQLFCFSAISRLGCVPTVVVHQSQEPLRREFRTLAELGIRVVQAPSFARHPAGIWHAPRNELGTLLYVATNPKVLRTEHILLCETDMIFVAPLLFSSDAGGEYYGYLDYKQPRIRALAREVGVECALGKLDETKVGVPYLIPREAAEGLARRWFSVLDTLKTLEWIDMMYAFGLASAAEGLDMQPYRTMNTNVRSAEPVTGRLIHYCYGDARWDKRSYISRGTPFEVPDDQLPPGSGQTILGEIGKQIREAREYFKGARSLPGASLQVVS